MRHRNNSFYFKEKLLQRCKNPKELWKTLKTLGLNAKGRNKTKISLNGDGTIQFEPRENISIFKKVFSKLAKNLGKKLPAAPNKFNNGTTKDYYISIINNKKQFSVIQRIRRHFLNINMVS